MIVNFLFPLVKIVIKIVLHRIVQFKIKYIVFTVYSTNKKQIHIIPTR